MGRLDSRTKVIDYETYSDVNIKEEGARKYILHPSFKVLVFESFDIPTPKEFENTDKKIIIAHNADFDASVMDRIGMDIKDYIFISTDAMSRFMGGPRDVSLDTHLDYWKLGVNKDDGGKRLIHYFHKYKNPSEDPKGEWYENFKKFIDYCRYDVYVTNKLYSLLYNKIIKEQGSDIFVKEVLYFNDTLKLNMKGVLIDTKTLNFMGKKLSTSVMKHRRLFNTKYKFNPSSPAQVISWCKEGGKKYPLNTTNKSDVLFHWSSIDKKIRDMYKLKWKTDHYTIRKLMSIKKHIYNKNKLNPNLIHFGTHTGRYTSLGVNMLNFPRSNKKTLLVNREVLHKQLDEADFYHNEGIKNLLRLCVVSEHNIACIDYKQVEFRFLLWMLGKNKLLKRMYDGFDFYTMFTKKALNKDNITPDERTAGKECVLSLGYGNSMEGVLKRLGSTKYKQEVVKLYKLYFKTFKGVRDLWGDLFKELSSNGYITLPNKVKRFYDIKKVTYSGGYTKSPMRVGSTLLSNKCQSMVREVMAEKKHLLLKFGFNILFDAHDEIVFDTIESDIDSIRVHMEDNPDWIDNEHVLQTDVDVEKHWA